MQNPATLPTFKHLRTKNFHIQTLPNNNIIIFTVSTSSTVGDDKLLIIFPRPIKMLLYHKIEF